METYFTRLIARKAMQPELGFEPHGELVETSELFFKRTYLERNN